MFDEIKIAERKLYLANELEENLGRSLQDLTLRYDKAFEAAQEAYIELKKLTKEIDDVTENS